MFRPARQDVLLSLIRVIPSFVRTGCMEWDFGPCFIKLMRNVCICIVLDFSSLGEPPCVLHFTQSLLQLNGLYTVAQGVEKLMGPTSIPSIRQSGKPRPWSQLLRVKESQMLLEITMWMEDGARSMMSMQFWRSSNCEMHHKWTIHALFQMPGVTSDLAFSHQFCACLKKRLLLFNHMHKDDKCSSYLNAVVLKIFKSTKHTLCESFSFASSN